MQGASNGGGDRGRINATKLADKADGTYSASPPLKRDHRKLIFLALVVATLLLCAGIGLGVALRAPSSDAESSSTSQSSSESSGSDDSLDIATPSPTQGPATEADGDGDAPVATAGSGTEDPKMEMDDASLGGSPSVFPSDVPSASPTQGPTDGPTGSPTDSSSGSPTPPTGVPTTDPTSVPTAETSPPTADATNDGSESVRATYIPGDLTRFEENILLSEGLLIRLIAQSGEKVEYFAGDNVVTDSTELMSSERFHVLPDGAATFADTRDWNLGGWVYVSNSENKEMYQGGVGAVTFDKEGRVITTGWS